MCVLVCVPQSVWHLSMLCGSILNLIFFVFSYKTVCLGFILCLSLQSNSLSLSCHLRVNVHTHAYECVYVCVGVPACCQAADFTGVK